MPIPPDDQRAQDRWRTHVRMAEQALSAQGDQWERAHRQHRQRCEHLERGAPRWQRWWWANGRRWGRWHRARWERARGLPSQERFLHDWRVLLDALPGWIANGRLALDTVGAEVAESLWDRWRAQGLFLLDGLLNAHPQRRGNVMPFRGLRHTLASAVVPHRSVFAQALVDGRTLEAVLAGVPEAPDTTDAQGYSPLHHALLAERWDVAEALLQRGADPNRAVAHRTTVETPLFLAALTGQLVAVQGLLAAGASPNGGSDVRTPWYSPLHVAAQSGHAQVVWALIEAGAMLHRHDPSGHTATDLAMASGHDELAGTLRYRTARPLETDGPAAP